MTSGTVELTVEGEKAGILETVVAIVGGCIPDLAYPVRQDARLRQDISLSQVDLEAIEQAIQLRYGVAACGCSAGWHDVQDIASFVAACLDRQREILFREESGSVPNAATMRRDAPVVVTLTISTFGAQRALLSHETGRIEQWLRHHRETASRKALIDSEAYLRQLRLLQEQVENLARAMGQNGRAARIGMRGSRLRGTTVVA